VPLPRFSSPFSSPPHRSYLEIYEYLLSRGADPTIRTKDFDPYLDPGRKTPAEMAVPDPAVRAALATLEAKYAATPKARRPHPDIGCWWTLYDYGVDVVKGWAVDYVHPYPGEGGDARAKTKKKGAIFFWSTRSPRPFLNPSFLSLSLSHTHQSQPFRPLSGLS
jgi:hypothetical protein